MSRPARLPLVADQVSPAVTLAAMARQVFSLLPAHHPSVGAPQAARTGWLGLFGQLRPHRYHRPGRDSLETILGPVAFLLQRRLEAIRELGDNRMQASSVACSQPNRLDTLITD